MPAALTHFCFALEVEPHLTDAFRLGNQGPDPFFFYGMIPWKKRAEAKEIQDLAETLHKTDFSLCYAKMWVKASEEENADKRKLLQDYVRGLLAHYCLDRTCHPYVFYRSGFDEEGKLAGHYSFAHKVFEALLDLSVAKKYGVGRNPAKAMRIKDEDAKSISLLWASGLEILKEDTFYFAYKDYLTIESFLQSRTGWKRPLWKLLGKEGSMYGFTYPSSIKKYGGRDVENEKHGLWEDPVSGAASNKSVKDLFDVSTKLFKVGEDLLLGSSDIGALSSSLSAWEEGIDHDGSPLSTKKTHRDEASPF